MSELTIHTATGAARARGFDPDGKFVGAKMAFRF